MTHGEILKDLYKAIIDKSYELDVVIEGTLLVKFDNGTVYELKVKKNEQHG